MPFARCERLGERRHASRRWCRVSCERLGNVQQLLVAEDRASLRAMQTLVAKCPAMVDSIRLTAEITPGLAFVELLHRVCDRAQDLIVVGANGITLLEDAFVGGTAEQVVKQASCSVPVVRGQSPA
jgi:nucleotide-binding universal stress UspA family protein